MCSEYVLKFFALVSALSGSYLSSAAQIGVKVVCKDYYDLLGSI